MSEARFRCNFCGDSAAVAKWLFRSDVDVNDQPICVCDKCIINGAIKVHGMRCGEREYDSWLPNSHPTTR